jgi:hypothetical protein
MTNGGTVLTPPLHWWYSACSTISIVKVLQTQIILKKWCDKHFAAPTLTDRLMTNHWAGVSGNGNRIISRWWPNSKRREHLSPWSQAYSDHLPPS